MLQAVQYGQAMKHKQVTGINLPHIFSSPFRKKYTYNTFRNQKSIHSIICRFKKRHKECPSLQRIQDILDNLGKFEVILLRLIKKRFSGYPATGQAGNGYGGGAKKRPFHEPNSSSVSGYGVETPPQQKREKFLNFQ